MFKKVNTTIVIVIITVIVIFITALGGLIYFISQIIPSGDNQSLTQNIVNTTPIEEFCKDRNEAVFEMCSTSLYDGQRVVETKTQFDGFFIYTYKTEPTNFLDRTFGEYYSDSVSFLNNSTTEKYEVPDPSNWKFSDNYFYSDTIGSNKDIIFRIPRGSSDLEIIPFTPEFNINNNCSSQYEEMIGYLDDTFEKNQQILDQADELYPEAIFNSSTYDFEKIQERSDFIFKNSLLNDEENIQYSKNNFNYESNIEQEEIEIVFQNILVFVDGPDDRDKNNPIKIYRFVLEAEDDEYKSWEVRDCETLDGKYFDRRSYDLYEEYETKEYFIFS